MADLKKFAEELVNLSVKEVNELAKILKDYPARNLNDMFYDSYELRIKRAANQLLEILS